MSDLGPEDRALVLRHLAALRRTGVGAPAALRQVSNALPAGDVQRRLAQVADALDRGEQGDDTSDPLLAIVARGESAIPEVLDAAAEAYALQAAVRSAARDSALRIAFVLALAGSLFVLLFPATGIFKQIFDELGGTLPTPTALLLEARGAVVVLGLAALGAAILVVLRPDLFTGRVEKMFGTSNAARAGLVSAASAAGLPEVQALAVAGFTPDPSGSLAVLGQGRLELEATEWVRATQGFTRAMAFAAAGGAADSRRLLRLLSLGFELGAIVLLGLVVGLALVTFYLPIFSVAGAVQ